MELEAHYRALYWWASCRQSEPNTACSPEGTDFGWPGLLWDAFEERYDFGRTEAYRLWDIQDKRREMLPQSEVPDLEPDLSWLTYQEWYLEEDYLSLFEGEFYGHEPCTVEETDTDETAGLCPPLPLDCTPDRDALAVSGQDTTVEAPALGLSSAALCPESDTSASSTATEGSVIPVPVHHGSQTVGLDPQRLFNNTGASTDGAAPQIENFTPGDGAVGSSPQHKKLQPDEEAVDLPLHLLSTAPAEAPASGQSPAILCPAQNTAGSSTATEGTVIPTQVQLESQAVGLDPQQLTKDTGKSPISAAPQLQNSMLGDGVVSSPPQCQTLQPGEKAVDPLPHQVITAPAEVPASGQSFATLCPAPNTAGRSAVTEGTVIPASVHSGSQTVDPDPQQLWNSTGTGTVGAAPQWQILQPSEEAFGPLPLQLVTDGVFLWEMLLGRGLEASLLPTDYGPGQAFPLPWQGRGEKQRHFFEGSPSKLHTGFAGIGLHCCHIPQPRGGPGQLHLVVAARTAPSGSVGIAPGLPFYWGEHCDGS